MDALLTRDNVVAGAVYRSRANNVESAGAYGNCVDMTHLAELRDKLESTLLSRREIARRTGLSHTAISNFLADPAKASDLTVKIIADGLASGLFERDAQPTEQRPSATIEQKAAAWDLLVSLLEVVATSRGAGGAAPAGSRQEAVARVDALLREIESARQAPGQDETGEGSTPRRAS